MPTCLRRMLSALSSEEHHGYCPDHRRQPRHRACAGAAPWRRAATPWSLFVAAAAPHCGHRGARRSGHRCRRWRRRRGAGAAAGAKCGSTSWGSTPASWGTNRWARSTTPDSIACAGQFEVNALGPLRVDAVHAATHLRGVQDRDHHQPHGLDRRQRLGRLLRLPRVEGRGQRDRQVAGGRPGRRAAWRWPCCIRDTWPPTWSAAAATSRRRGPRAAGRAARCAHARTQRQFLARQRQRRCPGDTCPCVPCAWVRLSDLWRWQR